MDRTIPVADNIKLAFHNEYSFICDRFTLNNISIYKAESDTSPELIRPGVYIFWNQVRGVIKVGKSQTNSLKRALNHIQDGTKTKDKSFDMKALKGDSNTFLTLINIKDKKDMHWILGLEYYLEEYLHPLIPSDRRG